jgi:hypothetical protein
VAIQPYAWRGWFRAKEGTFYEQKEAKNLAAPGRAGFTATGPAETKIFAPLLIEKAAAFLPLRNIRRLRITFC